jgi:hypothetical protein
LDFEVVAGRDLDGRRAEIFRRTDREARLAQDAATGAEHAEIAGENIAAGNEVGRLKRGAGDDWSQRGAADDILAGIGRHGDDEADPEAPRRHHA